MSNHYDQDISQPRRWHKPKKADEVPSGQLSLFPTAEFPIPLTVSEQSDNLQLADEVEATPEELQDWLSEVGDG